MKASALALLVLLASSGYSAEAGTTASPSGPVMVQVAMPTRPDGPVLDQADILPTDAETMIEAQLTRLGGVSGDALVVVSVESLKGERIEDYAFTLFNTWGIGDAATDRGLLVLVAPNERKVRIEVGCGLESTISDDLAADIIQKRMLPEFQQGDFAAGVQAGVDALIERMELPQPANDPGPHSALCTADMRNAA